METMITLQAKQEEALRRLSDVSILGYGGAKGGGKSYLIRAWQLLRRDKYAGTKGLIIRKTYPELLNNHINQMWIEHPGLRQYFNKSEKTIYFPNGSTLSFGYLQRTDDVYNYQGQEFEDIAIDEGTQHAEEVPKILRSSNRTINPHIKPKMLICGNPGGVGHSWFRRLFIDQEYEENENPNDYAFVQAKVYDNKILMDNDPTYVARLEALPEEKRRAYLDGDWDVFEGQFFEEFRKSVHVIGPRYDLKSAPDNYTYRLGWDEGTLNPRSVHLLVQDNDAKIDIAWEYYKEGETADVAAQNVKTQLEDLGILKLLQKRGRLACDPSMKIKSNQTGVSTEQVVQKILGISLGETTNNRIEGARRYRSYLAWSAYQEPLLQIWSTCRNLIRTLPALVYDERNNEDCDTSGSDHAYDSTRYGIMSFTQMPSRFGASPMHRLKLREEGVRIGHKPLGGY